MLELIKNRSFTALTVSQFLGAFNDNAFKQLVLLMATGIVAVPWAESSMLGSLGNPQVLPATLFALPFVLFGAITGSLADRASKSAIIKTANVLEIVVMGLAFLAFTLESYDLLLGTVFLMGTQSALFGPSKYGSIKEIVGERHLSGSNAVIQMTTMLAVLFGIMVAGQFGKWYADDLRIPGMFYIAFAIAGMLVSLRIRPLAPASPNRRLTWNVFSEIRSHWRAMGEDTTLKLSVLASAFFYMVAATLLLVVNDYGKYLGLDSLQTAKLNAMTVIGIALGSIIAGKVSGERIESGLVPIGLFGMSASLAIVQFNPTSVGLLRTAMLGTGIAAGLFSVPVRALIQMRPSNAQRGAVLGLSEVLDFVGILVAGGVVALLSSVIGLTPPQSFIAVSLLVLTFLAVSLYFTAEFGLRLGLFLLVHSVYRIRPKGMQNIPQRGGALLAVNHVSFVDALLVGAAVPRKVHFLMYRAFFDVPVVGWFARKMGAIPVSAGDTREKKREALETAAAHAADGKLVCIFAEGAITRTGTMLRFARGMEHIARQAAVPIVPIALDRVWGSIFSFEGGKVFWKRPHRIPYPVDVLVGEPLPSETPAWVARNAVQELVAENLAGRDGRRGSLAWRFLRSARIHARRTAVVDSSGQRLTYRQLLISSLAMRSLLEPKIADDSNVGILLPQSAGGTITNVALALLGKASVNLNYTMSNTALASPIRTAEVRHVITSKLFLRAIDRESPLPPENTLYLEDLVREIGWGMKLRAALVALLPPSLLARACSPQRSAREPATILFSSGSTGEPKGVVLSHGNILSNIQGVLQMLSIEPEDVILGVLPFFHSFGYTITMWAPLLAGSKAVYHANPLDAKVIGELARTEGATLLAATPTFYQAYLRRVTPEQFTSLRIALSGAEKLRSSLSQAWEKKFGKPLYEGYGCTELSPVVSFNTPDVELMGELHKGNKPNSIGRPLPGVAVRIVHPETRELLQPENEGLLEVKGPNVMLGYCGRPEATAEVIQNGWYATGDIARLDRDGFLAITDRLSRFSKIGGEMVPHGRVEELLRRVVAKNVPEGKDGPDIAVTALPDERKGEQLVVLHTGLPLPVEDVLQELGTTDLPKLFLPRASNFVQIESVPKLGSGKTDWKELRAMAESALR